MTDLLKDAQASLARGDAARAHELLVTAASARPADAHHLHNCGLLFSQLGDQRSAHDLFKAALELQPDNAQLCHNLATVHRFLGNLAEAEAYAERAVRLDPTVPEAVFIRSDVRKVTQDRNHIDDIRALIDNGKVTGRALTQSWFALAKECEDIDAHDDSFAALTSACESRRREFDYDVKADVARITAIANSYDDAFFTAQRSGYSGERTPVFILGMPRTGSTLVERFLIAHSRIASAGERPDFSLHLARQTREILMQRGLGREDLVQASVDMDFARLGRDYLASTAWYAKDAPLFIDKLPLNYLYVGLILTALPDAKIIHTVRHPMDTCYAVYKALFERAYPFSYDLDELAAYYVAYRQLMDHWHRLLPGKILDVAYEDVVENTGDTVRKLIEFCGVDWEDACLSNVGGAAASMTASAAQARQPVYTSSLQKWRYYEEQLAPLRERLQDAGIDIE